MIRKVAVLGAGTMGSQIAAHAANAGLRVLLLDVTTEQARAGVQALAKFNPAPLFTPEIARQIEVGSFQDDLSRLKEADWIIEVVTEDPAIKKKLLDSVASARRKGTLITTNTSGLSIAGLAEGQDEDFRRHWFGTHFFNPPRYLKLLEIIPTQETDRAALAEFERFGDIVLGKAIVRAKDTPNFIANRIGLFAVFQAIHLMTESGLTIEEVDRLTGTLIGRAKTATFRTIDLVGLDILVHVADNIYQNVPSDERREIFYVPDFMRRMVEKKMIGAKSGQGFYKKTGDVILSVDPATLEYRPQQTISFPSLEMAFGIESLSERLKAVFRASDRPGVFVRNLLTSTVEYAASRIPEISDDPVSIDQAMKWGFAWEMGPFELAKSLEIDTGVSYDPDSVEIRPGWTVLKRTPVIHENAGATLRDLGDGVACLEFHSKMNTIGGDIMSLLMTSLDEVNSNFEGLVIGNQGKAFSAGANLMLLMMEAVEGNWDEIDHMIRTFQHATQSIRYNPKPVVTAPFAMTLGGGCEIAMAGIRTQAAAETYIGLVELAAGLIPAGGGTTEMLLRAAPLGPARVREVFQNIGLAKVSTSAADARRLMYLRPEDGITMNPERVIQDAKSVVLQLAGAGYRPPVPPELPVLGTSLGAELHLGIYLMMQAGHITEYDSHIARKLADVICGGNVTKVSMAPEQYFLDLEREAFISLCGDPRTLARMEHLLKKGKPLRN
jgi:3-hydroxyacyl-CoA dehydrogenase